jgi:hypothetical protein
MTELLKIHKVKLLEMCNKLFPEYCKFEFFTDELRFLAFENDKYLTFIHWFEFCWTNLIQQIYKENTPMERVNNINNFALICYNDFELNHPIDYLYEEFKKVK